MITKAEIQRIKDDWKNKGFTTIDLLTEDECDRLNDELDKMRIERNKSGNWGEYEPYQYPQRDSELLEKYFVNPKLLEEVVNIVEDPNLLHVNFNKDYLEIPKEIIISTLEKHQRYFPIFDSRERLTNYFFVVANKKDEKKLITQGNKKVVEARLADAKFFWDKDRSKNLIKQIANLKSVTFYEKLGTIYDKDFG